MMNWRRVKSINVILILLSLVVSTSCESQSDNSGEQPKSEKTTSAISGRYSIVSDESRIFWKAEQIGGGHEGYFTISGGDIEITGGKITKCNLSLDIESIRVTDIPEDDEDNEDLRQHLLNADFFDAPTYPKAYFEFTNMANATVSGNLKMKGIKKNITFPISIKTGTNKISIESEDFTIDRTDWNITYSSGKFFDPVKLGDHLIKDDVNISFSIVAIKM